MPNPIFLLTLDIDETLVNGETTTPNITDCDFNGSDNFNDPSAWIGLIETLEKKCVHKGYQLIVNLVTAKASGSVDDSIDACQRSSLANYLPARDSKGKPCPLSSYERYLVRRHLSECVLSEFFYNKLLECNQSKSEEGEAFSDDAILPAIHICCKNNFNKGTSKALVLKALQTFYDITPLNLKIKVSALLQRVRLSVNVQFLLMHNSLNYQIY